MHPNDTVTVTRESTRTRIAFPTPGPIPDAITVSRSRGETVVSATSRLSSAPIYVPDDALDHVIDALSRARELRDAGRGHTVVESLRGTEDGIALADALDRGRAA